MKPYGVIIVVIKPLWQHRTTVVAAFAHCSYPTNKTVFQDFYNWWKETGEQKQDNANLCKTKWSGSEKQQLNIIQAGVDPLRFPLKISQIFKR